MKTGCPISLLPRKIDYKQLRKINAEAARFAVLEYLKSDGHSDRRANEFL